MPVSSTVNILHIVYTQLCVKLLAFPMDCSPKAFLSMISQSKIPGVVFLLRDLSVGEWFYV